MFKIILLIPLSTVFVCYWMLSKSMQCDTNEELYWFLCIQCPKKLQSKGNSKRFVDICELMKSILFHTFFQFHNYIRIAMVDYIAAGHIWLIHMSFYPINVQIDTRLCKQQVFHVKRWHSLVICWHSSWPDVVLPIVVLELSEELKCVLLIFNYI